MWHLYLVGEQPGDWRETIADGVLAAGLEVTLSMPVIDLEISDNCGVHILGDEGNPFWKDYKAAKLNGIRNKKMMEKADIVVIKFSEHHRQSQSAFEAGKAAALGKSLIVIHPSELNYELKEIDAVADAVVQDEEQVIEIVRYLIDEDLV